ncbi:MAG: thiamine transport system permease protein [Parasphingorhabdus sp.]
MIRGLASSGLVTGYVAAAVVVALVSLPLTVLFLFGEGAFDTSFWFDRYIQRTLRFSLWQAFLSTLLSVLPAVLVSRALFRLGDFPGRRLMLGLFGLPLVVPAIVAVLGLISVFGTQGWFSLGRNLYGIIGILLAHIFFNLPLAIRLLLPAFEQIPNAQWRLADQYGMNAWQRWRLVEWPAIRAPFTGVALLIFMLCLTSFAVVLALGGGPKSTTLEVAIYQALRFDFDPGRAVTLAALQLSLCIVLAVLANSLAGKHGSEPDMTLRSKSLPVQRRISDILPVFLVAGFVGTILLAIVLDGVAGPVLEVVLDERLWYSAIMSLGIALSASLLAFVLGWLILRSAALEAFYGNHKRAHGLETAAMVIYVVPPLVLGTGLFMLLIGAVRIESVTIPVVILVNALMGVPFVVRTLQGTIRQRTIEFELLCRSLGIRGFARFRLIDYPLSRRQTGLAVALVAALALGDLGVVALFAGPQQTTVPLLLYHRLSAYQIPEASVTALCLLLFCLGLFAGLERLIGGARDAKT